ncbi:MAG TPA: hypothetical protein VMT59_13275 [Gaiellaceae bacterium]|nr:hypothetical protein [Gaiellaceae bacterium]
MKMKLILGVLALAGLAAAFAIASPSQANGGHHGKGWSTTGTSTGAWTGTTTGGHHGNSSCQRVELRGTNGSGSVALTVAKASSSGSLLVGKQVTLTVPAGSTVGATACTDAAGALTLRSLVVKPPVAAPTTTTTTASNTTKAPRSHHNSHH